MKEASVKRIWRQWRVSSWLDGEGDPAELEAVLGADEATHRFRDEAQRLAEQLRAEAREDCPDAPPALHGRIMARLDQDSSTAPIAWSWRPALAAAALTVMLGFTYLLAPQGTAPGPQPPALAHLEDHPSSVSSPTALQADAPPPWTQVGSLVDDRFATEVQGLTSDLDAAVRFIEGCLGGPPARRTGARA